MQGPRQHGVSQHYVQVPCTRTTRETGTTPGILTLLKQYVTLVLSSQALSPRPHPEGKFLLRSTPSQSWFFLQWIICSSVRSLRADSGLIFFLFILFNKYSFMFIAQKDFHRPEQQLSIPVHLVGFLVTIGIQQRNKLPLIVEEA